MIKQFLWIGCVLLFITACQKKYDYLYLVRHPDALKTALITCQAKVDKTLYETAQCETLAYAAENLSTLLEEQQQDPEGFGQSILDKQIAMASTKEKLLTARETLRALKLKDTPDAELKTAENNVRDLKKIYKQQADQIKILLAVAGLNTPE